MPSPAQSHYEKSMAQKAANSKAGPASSNGKANDAGAVLLAALGNDLRSLSEIRSIERKIAAKAGMIDRYADWVSGALKAGEEGNAVQDDIVGTILVWALDLQQWDYALTIAAHMLQHKIILPERFPRNVGTLLADEVGDAFLKRQLEVPVVIVQRVIVLTADHDVTDQANAKINKALGRLYAAQYDAFNPDADNAVAGEPKALLDAALTSYRRALELNPKAGVIKDIERLDREQKKLEEPTE